MPAYTLPYTGVIEVPANTILGNNTGSAAAAIGLTQAQTLTFLGNPGGAFGADVDTQITPSTAVVLDHATNNEVGLSLSYTTNKAAGNDTGLLIAMTDTASPGTSLPLDVQVGGSSEFTVDSTGKLTSYAGSSQINFANQFGIYGIGHNHNGATVIVQNTGASQVLGRIFATEGVIVLGAARGYNMDGTGIGSRFAPGADGVVALTSNQAGYALGQLNTGLLTAVAPAATDVPISITGAAAQSANLFEIGANGGTAGDVLKVDSTGKLHIGGTSIDNSGGAANLSLNGHLRIYSSGAGISQYLAWDAHTCRSDAYIGFASSTTVPTGQGDSNFYRVSAGHIGVCGSTTATPGDFSAGTITVVAPAATDVPISVTGAAAQSANLQEWAVNGGEVHARITDFGEFSNTGPGGIAGNYQNELFGLNAGDALTSGHSNTVMGWGALTGATTGFVNTAIGNGALALSNGKESTGVGYQAGKYSGNATRSTMIGAYTGGANGYNSDNCVFIGFQADTRNLAANTSGIICIGSESECDVDNTFVAGSNTFPANNVYFGKGFDNATPTAYTINGTGGSGTDIAGAAVNIAGGVGTGTGVGGDVVIQYAAAGSTGTAANTLAAALTVDGGTGNATFSGDVTLTAPTVPASATATGTTGTIAWDASYVYVCTATDTWKRVAIATW